VDYFIPVPLKRICTSMYLLKHICIKVNSVFNLPIVALVLSTSACLFSYTTSAGSPTQLPVIPGAEINACNGHVNTNLFYCNSDKCNEPVEAIQPKSVKSCNGYNSPAIS
jgi:hypothetical protein